MEISTLILIRKSYIVIVMILVSINCDSTWYGGVILPVPNVLSHVDSVDGRKVRMEKERFRMTEDQEQKQLIQWCRTRPELQFIFHIPNESVGGHGWLIRNRQLGVRKGIPDLMLPIPMHGYHGLFIEMKRSNGGVVSSEQKAWLSALNGFGYRAVVCHGWEEARKELMDYLDLHGEQ